ncbi:MAG: hypothetical protein U9Q97_05950 [Acidobacteriota bacterium]|nr:hypothetical protein [Acidobacteriota bacterium]
MEKGKLPLYFFSNAVKENLAENEEKMFSFRVSSRGMFEISYFSTMSLKYIASRYSLRIFFFSNSESTRETSGKPPQVK